MGTETNICRPSGQFYLWWNCPYFVFKIFYEVKDMDIYKLNDSAAYLSGNEYPGRGVMLGQSPEGKAVFAYFIMGRSENSRNRIFVEEGADVMIHPFDVSKVEDPSLIIYAPVRVVGKEVVVTNGDQTDTVRDHLNKGGNFYTALQTRCFEPDGPNWTPRISGILHLGAENFTYELSILKSIDAEGSDCMRNYYTYPAKKGLGHLIHTYEENGNPIPTFQGEPRRMAIPADIDAFTNLLWENLNESNKISLYVRYMDPVTGEYESRMINKHQK